MACPTTEDCEQLLTLCDLAPPNFPSWMSQSDRQKLVDSCPSFKSYQDLCSDGFKVFESTTSVEATVSVELELSSTSDPTNHSTQSPAILHSLSNESDDIAWVAPLVLFLLLSTAVFLVALWYCRKNKLRLVSVDMKMYTETNYFHNKAIKGERWGQRSDPHVRRPSINTREVNVNSLYKNARNKNNHNTTTATSNQSKRQTNEKSNEYQGLNFQEGIEHVYTLPNSHGRTKSEKCDVKNSVPSDMGGSAFPGDPVAAFQGVDNEAYQPDQIDQLKMFPIDSDQIPSKKKKKKKSNFYNILKKTDGKPTGATKMSKNKDRDGTETDC